MGERIVIRFYPAGQPGKKKGYLSRLFMRLGGFTPGMAAILFEGRIFWNQLMKKGLKSEDYVNGNEIVLYPKWTRKYYKGGIREYERLEQARKINREAADASFCQML